MFADAVSDKARELAYREWARKREHPYVKVGRVLTERAKMNAEKEHPLLSMARKRGRG